MIISQPSRQLAERLARNHGDPLTERAAAELIQSALDTATRAAFRKGALWYRAKSCIHQPGPMAMEEIEQASIRETR